MSSGADANRLRRALASGKVAYGLGLLSGSQSLVEISAHAGFDFLFLDMHQAPLGLETIHSLITAGDASGITTLVRVADFDPLSINLVLNSGAAGIVVPHVTSAEMAREIVQATRYPPLGQRGACPSSRAARYSATPWAEYAERANAEVFLSALIEDVKGFDDIEEIAAVEGVDALMLGPFDLSQELGIPNGNWLHPKMKVYFERAGAAARKSGVKIWTTTTSYMQPDYVKWLEDSGASLISFSTDEVIFFRACKRLLARAEM